MFSSYLMYGLEMANQTSEEPSCRNFLYFSMASKIVLVHMGDVFSPTKGKNIIDARTV